jgi:hypothetical protein
MYDIIRLAIKYSAESLVLQHRSAGLLREQWRQPFVAAAQSVNRHVGMFYEPDFRLTRVQHVVRINAVDDIDLMPGVSECVAETIEIHGVTAETVRRIERRQVEEVQRPSH